MNQTMRETELAYLEKVLAYIDRQLAAAEANAEDMSDELLEEKRVFWDEGRHILRDFDDVLNFSTMNDKISLAAERHHRVREEIARLRKMRHSPYFGRMDFVEADVPEHIYIGIHNLMDNETFDSLVYDWRAAICSAFYDCDLGSAWYETAYGRQKIDVTGKRQFQIVDGVCEQMYDAESSIRDDVLGNVLSGNTSNRLKVIVGSIQKEQNTAIRNTKDRLLLICGPAGSGKTSVGLHRLAYLLYHDRDKLKSENIVVLSNNGIYHSYVSAILPELGEKRMRQPIFSEVLASLLPQKTIQPYYAYVSDLARNPDSARAKRIRQKYGRDFVERCIGRFADFPFVYPTLYYKEQIVCTKEVLAARIRAGGYTSFPAVCHAVQSLIGIQYENYFLSHRDEIIEDLLSSSEEFLYRDDAQRQFRQLQKAMTENAMSEFRTLNRIDAEVQFTELLRQTQTEPYANGQMLLFEDALLYALVRLLMGEIVPDKSVSHVLIDEAQDYNLLQLMLMKLLYPNSSFTILADINQAVRQATSIQDTDDFAWVFGEQLTTIQLHKSYRSSGPINALAFQVLAPINAAHEMDYFNRDGKKPALRICGNCGKTLMEILHAVTDYHLIGIIANDEAAARKLYAALGRPDDIQLVVDPYDSITGKVVILPLLYAKGLEFDAVIAVDCLTANRSAVPDARRAVYLTCTRALHELMFLESQPLPNAYSDLVPYLDME